MLKTDGSPVYIDALSGAGLQKLITRQLNPSSVVILTDENTHEHCLSYLLTEIPALQDARIIEITSGEECKNLETCHQIWQTLLQMECDRQTVFVNLGGGVITDMGGFVAATFKRGIRFINIPTTLLAQVDAAVGNKTGIDLGVLKNQVGLFASPEAIFVDTHFLRTLSKRELMNGFAEMIKHALLDSTDHWNEITLAGFNKLEALKPLIERSITFKISVTQEDPDESGKRKILNFGHTIGHAIESFSLEADRKPLKHGEAVAIGMVTELYLSCKQISFPKDLLYEITAFILRHYPAFTFDRTDVGRMIEIMRADKKNIEGKINFSLLRNIGDPVYNQTVTGGDIEDALMFYQHQVLHTHE